ncbi:MAG: hypothetical protein WKG01_09245 [Kofleriaceae bacterium]
MLKLLIPALGLALGCGGSVNKPVTSPQPVVAAPEPAPEPPKPAPAPDLTMGAAKINMLAGPDAKIEVVLAADGTFTGTGTQASTAKTKAKAKKAAPKITKKTGTLAEREAMFDGHSVAKLGDDGTVTVAQHMIEKVDGQPEKRETTWQPIGVLDAEGVFTSAKDGAKFSVGGDGKVAGFPAEMAVQVEAAAEMRRTAMFLVLAVMSGDTQVTMSTTGSTNKTVPVEPIKTK